MSDTRKLFFIDGLGALVTAFLLFAVLAQFEEVFGMPREALNYLGIIACVFAVYSFCCYLFAGARSRILLRVIAGANTLYCIATVVLCIGYYERLTAFGLAYFAGEIAVILVLVTTEVKATSVGAQ